MIVLDEQLALYGSSRMATDQLQATIKQVQGLSFEEQLQLIKYLADRLAESQPKSEARYLVYGEFRNSGTGRMSTEEDFKIAEWNPTEEELNEF
jgi:hypothetical protein